ncbi:MAG: PQQ-binding-like beta-propeller repeat protein [Planctomycetaceae bacterium]|nr:PQQ-binding-like beta-propeller repeat protein [Planctomycetaceae bacterium]
MSPFANAADVQHRFIAADSSTGRIALINEAGETEWEHKIGPLHDLQLLPNGHLLLQTSWTRLVEADLSTGEVVWEHEIPADSGPVEVHAFERLGDGRTMFAESGPARITEIALDGRLLRTVPLRVDRPHPHHDTRLVRVVGDRYLVCHENDGVVREYDATGQVVWDYAVPLFGRERRDGHGPEGYGNQCFAALRLPSGNTLITTGNGHGVIEVTPEREVVWQLSQHDLPGITLAWVTTVQVLRNGNLVIGNCHAGPENPQVIELDRQKRVVWSFRDFERFGNALTNSWIIEPPAEPADKNR